jgi:ABC-type Mn2+/Zn2+ transport system ATPase subunit
MSTLINVENLTIGYDKPLVTDLNFDLETGKILQICGQNGCGKTTLLKTILGQLRPLKGNVTTRGDFTYLPQLIRGYQHFSLTLGEILSCSVVNPKILELFSDEMLNKKWSDASGGQRQKTLIASRIHNVPEILVLDEPFNHLDKSSISLVETLLVYMLEHHFIKGLIIVSHLPIEGMDKFIKMVDL